MYEIATHLAAMARRFRLTPLGNEPPLLEARINYRLRSDLPLDKLETMTVEAKLDEVPGIAAQILKGAIRGRVVVDVNR